MASGRPSIFPLVPVMIMSLAGFSFIYVFVSTGESGAVVPGLALLLITMFAAVAVSSAYRSEAVAAPSASVALVCSLALLAALLPSSGNVYADAVVVFAVTAGAVTIFPKAVALPDLGSPRLRDASVAVVFLLPIGLAFAEALFLGLRFWESFHLGGEQSLFFIPFLALWGFLEEALFRGLVQRSMVPALGPGYAIAAAAVLNAAFMLFWGSLMFAIYTLLMGLVMGYLYRRTRSVVYVGTVHALQDTWLIIAFMVLGIGA